MADALLVAVLAVAAVRLVPPEAWNAWIEFLDPSPPRGPAVDSDWLVTRDAVLDWSEFPAAVREDFLPRSRRVDRRRFVDGGVLLVPDDLVWSAAPPPDTLRVIRTRRPGDVRFVQGGYVPEPTVGPGGPSGAGPSANPVTG